MPTLVKTPVFNQFTATDVSFSQDMMHVMLSDGREIRVPLHYFPSLYEATEQERNNWRLIGNGVGIHFEDLDEDISTEGLL
ncbi:DUF2442 domain-containing protein [Candidatus Peregrinibacteria bacterium]|jgi:hypothetical protein|nr:DUF2442 domain-containing protein [Candidatus Peregrinibacteria bacterium]